MAATVSLAENKKQEEGKALTGRAKQLSDIRADGLPAFQMKVGFKIIKKDSTTTGGTYTETWASREKWRSETIFGDFHRVMVVNGNQRWTSNTSPAESIGIGELGFRMELAKFSPDWADRIRDRESNSRMLRCLESKPNYLGGRLALCFDKATGFVAENIQPVVQGDRAVERICTYSDYQPFGEKTFPRFIRCSENQDVAFESTVLELTTASPDPTLFEPPPGGKESANCRGVPNPPKAIYTPDPVPPRREDPPHPVVLLLYVGIDGIPNNVTVGRSVDSAFDKAAIEAVRNWRFKPANCDGQPVEVQMSVEIRFRTF